MMRETRGVDQHPGELLSGFIDGELSQQQRQRVTLHCEMCADCRQKLAELRVMRDRIGQTHLSELGEDKWRETMNDLTVQTSRSVGWLLFIAGILIITGIGLYVFIVDASISIGLKLVMAAIYGGLAVLLFSVLRQRLIERKTDKYKDVEI